MLWRNNHQRSQQQKIEKNKSVNTKAYIKKAAAAWSLKEWED